MPMYELGLPVSSNALKVSHNGVDYSLVLGTDTFTRVGKDGNEIILPLCGGDEFVGAVLPGEWKKAWDADIATFTAMGFRFVNPAVASTRLEVRSSAGGDTTQTLTVTGIVAGAVDTEDFTLAGVAWQNGAKDFTEVWKIELDAACVGTVTVQDSTAATIYVLPIGDLLRERFTSLMMGGESDSAGTPRSGWINNHHPFVMMNEAELTVELEIPTADTTTPTHDIQFEFYIRQDKALTSPTVDPDFILIRHFVTDAGLILQLYKEVGGVNTPLWDGSTADGNAIPNVAADLFWIFRFVFHDGVAGAAAPEDVRHMHVYAKHGDSRVAAEAATEEELFDTVGTQASPYDISDLLFNVGYPAYQIVSANETWFGASVGSGLEAISTYLRISYPTLFALKYNFVDASYGYGDVELWDQKGSATEADWQQVYDEDHTFSTYDIVLQNGLVRLVVDRLQQYGLEFYFYDTGTSAWIQPFNQLFFHAVTSNKDLSYPVIRSIESISPEKTAIIVRLLDSATVNDDYYIDVRITLERGKYTLKIDSLDVFPDQDVRFWFLDSTTLRFGYVQDGDVGDDDIGIDGDNATPTDNFLIALDDDGEAVIGVVSTDEDPAGGNARFFAQDGGDLSIEDVDTVDTAGTIIWVSLIPFDLIAELFVCASTIDKDGADTATPGVGEACNEVLRMAAQDEGGHWIRTAATHLPEGRYLAILRDRAITGVQNYDVRVYNNDDSEYRNEENAYVTFLAQITAWTYRQLVFDVTAADVATTDDIWIQVTQPNAGPNTVYIDYILLIPISDGENWPQDLAHAAMRTFTKPRRLYVR